MHLSSFYFKHLRLFITSLLLLSVFNLQHILIREKTVKKKKKKKTLPGLPTHKLCSISSVSCYYMSFKL